MTAAQYLIGLAFFAGTVGCAAISAAVTSRACLANVRGAPFVLGWATLFSAAVIVAHLIPGIVGVLSRGSALAAALILAASLVVLTRRKARGAQSDSSAPGRTDPAATDEWRAMVLPGALAVVVVAWALVLLAHRHALLATPPFSFDMLTFDLPLVGRWIQAGSLWVSRDLVPLQSHAAYPQNGDVVCLALILPWRNAFLMPLSAYPLWALASLGVYAIGLELGAHRAAATLAAALCAATPLFLLPTAVAAVPDVFMWAMFGAGSVFLLRHRRTQRTRDLLIAALALGLAFGSKWYSLSTVPIVVAAWGVAAWWSGVGRRTILRQLATVMAVIFAVGGFWLVRNAVEYGDPIFPHAISVFGVKLVAGVPDPYGDKFGFSVAHYLGDWSVWRDYILPEYKAVLRLPGALLLVGLVVATLWSGWHVRRRVGAAFSARAALYTGLAGLVIWIVYVATPQTALGPEGQPTLVGINARYAAPGLLLAAAVVAWGLSRVGGISWALAQVVAALAAVDAFHEPLSVSLVQVALAATGVGVSAYATYRLLPRLRGAGAAAALAASLLTLAAVGYAQQRRYISHGLQGRDEAVDWVLTNARDHKRIGMTGTWSPDFPPVLAMLGPRFGNTVHYVGPAKNGLVHHFSTYARWLRAVRQERLDLLLVGRKRQALESNVEARWAERAGFPRVVRSRNFTLYRMPTVADTSASQGATRPAPGLVRARALAPTARGDRRPRASR